MVAAGARRRAAGDAGAVSAGGAPEPHDAGGRGARAGAPGAGRQQRRQGDGRRHPDGPDRGQRQAPADRTTGRQRAGTGRGFPQHPGTVRGRNAFVLNGDGDTLAYLNNKGAAPWLGRNLAHRPYWRRALAGQANVYPAVGGTSHERGLYFTAPVYSGPTRHTPVSGAYVIKIPMTPIDALLGRGKHTALLLSPDGVVFAASEPEWVLRLAAPLPTARRAELHAGQQFGQLFADATPTSAPASAAIAASALTSPSAAPIQNATPPNAE